VIGLAAVPADPLADPKASKEELKMIACLTKVHRIRPNLGEVKSNYFSNS